MTTLHEREGQVDLFDFGQKLGPICEQLLREFIEDLGGEVVEGGAEERVLAVLGLTPESVQEVCRLDLQKSQLAAFS